MLVHVRVATCTLVGVTFLSLRHPCVWSIANSQYSCVRELCTVVTMITVVGVVRYMQPPKNESTKNIVIL